MYNRRKKRKTYFWCFFVFKLSSRRVCIAKMARKLNCKYIIIFWNINVINYTYIRNIITYIHSTKFATSRVCAWFPKCFSSIWSSFAIYNFNRPSTPSMTPKRVRGPLLCICLRNDTLTSFLKITVNVLTKIYLIKS